MKDRLLTPSPTPRGTTKVPECSVISSWLPYSALSAYSVK